MVFPARAGMSPTVSERLSSAVSFPRASGDEPDARKRWDQIITFSPRERG